MAKDTSGSNLGCTIEGISFRVMADANITETVTKFENVAVATSGPAIQKKTKRITIREGIVLGTNAAEREQLKTFAESLDWLQCSYTNAAGDNYQCEGLVEVENNETEENRTTLQIQPRTDWTLFEG